MRILVIGAGPAGAAAACDLAASGARVDLVERSAWPRAKTCGDGISPEGVRIARELGVPLDDRMRLPTGVMSTPAHRWFRGGWKTETPWGAIVERRDFDDRLVQRAIANGACFRPQTTASALANDDGGGASATLTENGRAQRERYDAVVLGEGATGKLGAEAGFGAFGTRLVAIRGYVRTDRELAADFALHFDRALMPGYAWIFPLEKHLANVGVLVDDRFTRTHRDLRAVLAAWLRESPFARDALGANVTVERTSGGIVPTGRMRRAVGAIFAAGDAAGTADPFSAEGIAPAMDSARSLAASLAAHGGDLRRARGDYARRIDIWTANARAAYRMRMVFAHVVEPIAARAAVRPELANLMSSEGFFRKSSVVGFCTDIVRHW
jgi:geranylgeranyl reductase family protein